MANFTRVKPAGWALNEVLTSAQINQLDIDHAASVNGDGGGSWAGVITWAGAHTFQAIATFEAVTKLKNTLQFSEDNNTDRKVERAQQTGTGATAPAKLTYKGQDGRAQSGGANNNDGGVVEVLGGQAGTGGSGTLGKPGGVHLRPGFPPAAQNQASGPVVCNWDRFDGNMERLGWQPSESRSFAANTTADLEQTRLTFPNNSLIYLESYTLFQESAAAPAQHAFEKRRALAKVNNSGTHSLLAGATVVQSYNNGFATQPTGTILVASGYVRISVTNPAGNNTAIAWGVLMYQVLEAVSGDADA